MSGGARSDEPVGDDELWSTLGYDGLAVVWGIDPSGLGADRRRTLTTETIALRRRDPERLARLQDEILARPAADRIGALTARLL